MKFSAKKTPKVLTEIPRTSTSWSTCRARYSVHLGVEDVGELLDRPEPQLGLEEERELDDGRCDARPQPRELRALRLAAPRGAGRSPPRRAQELAPVAVEREVEVLEVLGVELARQHRVGDDEPEAPPHRVREPALELQGLGHRHLARLGDRDDHAALLVGEQVADLP